MKSRKTDNILVRLVELDVLQAAIEYGRYVPADAEDGEELSSEQVENLIRAQVQLRKACRKYYEIL